MYNCDKHGLQKTAYCEGCNTYISCDCSETDTTRFKDLIYDCADGERTVTIHIKHCTTCGDVVSVDF